MNLHQLKLFFYVAKFKSVTKAAEFLHISQPSISKQIKAFEDTYNQKLYFYENKQIHLTEIGQEIFETSQIIFETEILIENKLNKIKEIDILRIEGNSLATSVIIPRLVPTIKEKFPKHGIEIITNSTHEIIKNIENYTTHVGVIGAYEKEIKHLLYEPLLTDYFSFYINKNHPLANQKVSLTDLKDFAFIGRTEGSYSQERLKLLFAHLEPNLPNVTTTYDLAIDSIKGLEHNQSIYFGSSLLTDNYIKDTSIIPLDIVIPRELEYLLEHQLYVVYSAFFSAQLEINTLIPLITNKNI